VDSKIENANITSSRVTRIKAKWKEQIKDVPE
jgi:hypothetical protein